MISKNILFIHAPKNGGTSFQTILLKNNFVAKDYLINSLSDIVNNEIKPINNYLKTQQLILYNTVCYCMNNMYNQHWTLKQYSEIMDIRKKDIIFICRNPVDKILSAYFFLDHNLPFDEFVKYLVKGKNSGVNYSFIDPIFIYYCITQKDYISVNGKVNKRVNIIHLENKKEMENVLRKYGLTYYDIIKNKNSEKKEIKISKKTLNLIYKEYREDFEYFGYKMV